MRMTTAIFDADEQDRLITNLARTGIEDRMRRIRPVVRREDRIVRMALKQLGKGSESLRSLSILAVLPSMVIRVMWNYDMLTGSYRVMLLGSGVWQGAAIRIAAVQDPTHK